MPGGLEKHDEARKEFGILHGGDEDAPGLAEGVVANVAVPEEGGKKEPAERRE
jgi:hypothetical protein